MDALLRRGFHVIEKWATYVRCIIQSDRPSKAADSKIVVAKRLDDFLAIVCHVVGGFLTTQAWLEEAVICILESSRISTPLEN